MQAIRATWPPAQVRRVGPFDVPLDGDGTRRSQAARLARPGGTDAEIAAVEAARPGGVIGTLDGDPVAARLAALGYAEEGASVLMAGAAEPLAGALPRVSGFPHWPPLAICDALWDATGNPAPRRAPMERAPLPKTAILTRTDDAPSGILFAACDGDCAALHALAVLPGMRRRGVGMLLMRHAARWALANGGRWLVLPVEAANAPARALYARAGLGEVGGYRYWRSP